MADLLATLFKLQQFVFEYAPFFLTAWLGLAVTTGLITALHKRGSSDPKAPGDPFPNYKPLGWVQRLLFFMLWRPRGKAPALSSFSGLFFFSLAASVPALVVTSLLGMETVLLRLALAALYALFLSWIVTSVLPHKRGNSGEQSQADSAFSSQVLNGDTPSLPPGQLRSMAQVSWKSFIGQADGAVIPLVIGLILASALTIYVPAYVVRPWLGEGAWQGPYLAALLAMPFQLAGGAGVILASALLVKGASLGTVLSVMLVAPSTTFIVIRRLGQPRNVKNMILYLVATWLAAGSLGAAVDGIQRLLTR